MPRSRKVAKQCEGCHRDRPARFRLTLNLFVCDDCFGVWMRTGKLPDPEFEDEDFEAPSEEERRW